MIENNVENSTESAELEQLKLDTKNKFIDDLKQNGISNDYAIEDILAKVTFHAVDFQGKNVGFIRNVEGKVIDSETMIKNLKNKIPDYFRGYNGNAGNVNSTNNDNLATLSEHHILSLLQQIEEGKVKALDDTQKAALLKTFSELNKIDYTPGSTKKRIGKYDAMGVYRLLQKAGGPR